MTFNFRHTECRGHHHKKPRERSATRVVKQSPLIDWESAERVVNRNAPKLARVFNRFAAKLQDLFTRQMWETALRTGDPTALTAILDQVNIPRSGIIDPIEIMKSDYEEVQVIANEAAKDYLRVIIPISMAAGTTAYAAVGGLSVAEARASFTVMNPYVVPAAEKRVGWLIQEVVRSNNQGIRQAVASAIQQTYAQEMGPEATYRMIREIVGLRPDQIKALSNVEARLIAQGLKGERLTRRMLREQSKRLRYRSELIGRTEIRLAQSTGRHDGWKQAQADGLFKGKTAIVEWVAGGINVCDICIDLDGSTAVLGNNFQSTDALPTDNRVNNETPPVHPNCQCTTILRLE